MEGTAFVDDAYVPVDEARLPLLDWGFLRSDATYDVAHVWHGSFFRLRDHVERFLRGIERLRLRVPYDRSGIEAILHECARQSGLRDAYVEMICTRGLPRPGSRDPREAANAFYAFAIPFVSIADAAQREHGLSLYVSDRHRIPPDSVDPTVKNYHWLDLTLGLFDAYEHGADTVLLVDAGGNVAEGPGFNVFAVLAGTLTTPAGGVLNGITRRTVIELARDSGITVDERPLSVNELRAASEVLLTSTAGGVVSVTTLDGHPVGKGEPGPVTRQLTDAYWRLHDDPRYSSPVTYDRA